MPNKILVLGGSGNIGTVVVDQLVSEGHFVYVADVCAPKNMDERDIAGCYQIKFQNIYQNIHEIDELKKEKFDLAVCLLPSFAAKAGIDACYFAGIPLVVDASFAELDDLSSDHQFYYEQQNMLILRDCGIAPGISNLLAARAYQQIPEDKRLNSEIHILVGGNALPHVDTPLCGYAAKWSMNDILEEYKRPAQIVCNGQAVTVPACSGLCDERIFSQDFCFEIDIPKYESFISDGLRTLTTYMKDIGFATERTLRRTGHLEKVLSLEEIDLRAQLEKSQSNPDDIYLQVWKRVPGEQVQSEEFYLKCNDRYSAMAMATGYSCCAFVNLLLSDESILNCYSGVIYPELLAEMGRSSWYKSIFDYLNQVCPNMFNNRYPFMGE